MKYRTYQEILKASKYSIRKHNQEIKPNSYKNKQKCKNTPNQKQNVKNTKKQTTVKKKQTKR